MNDVTAGQSGEVRFSLRNKELNCFASVCVCLCVCDVFAVCLMLFLQIFSHLVASVSNLCVCVWGGTHALLLSMICLLALYTSISISCFFSLSNLLQIKQNLNNKL